MSVLFPRVQKPRAWDYRPIYYDAEKEKQQKVREKYEALRREHAEKEKADGEALCDEQHDGATQESGAKTYYHTMHRGSFREARELSEDFQEKSRRQSKTVFFIAALLLVVVLYLLLR